MLLSLVGYQAFRFSKHKKTLTDSVKALGENYTIQTTIELPTGTTTYLEVVNPRGSYTEYPAWDIDLDEEPEVVEFELYDWMLDGKLYEPSHTGEAQWSLMPMGYAKSIKNRESLYTNTFRWGFLEKTSIEEREIDGVVEFLTIYEGKLPSSIVNRYMRRDTVELYKQLVKEAKHRGDEVLKKSLSLSLKGYKKSLTYSYGDFKIGIGKSGVLRYLTLDAGGLGSRVNVTKQVSLNTTDTRPIPDFSSHLPYYENFFHEDKH